VEYVEVARADDARGEVVLRRRTDANAVDVLELRVNGVFVMDTQETSTEHALAEVALAQVADPRNVLIGGLGLGYTMRAVLEDVRVEKCVVVEIEGALIEWMRDGTVPHGPEFLADARLTIANLDIAYAVDELTAGGYDLVLLDVDNGPGHLVHDANEQVYAPTFLTAVRRGLAPGGALAIWSAAEAPELEETMRQVFGGATALEYDVDLQGRAETYWLYVSTNGATNVEA
jgi:spermidine synthase